MEIVLTQENLQNLTLFEGLVKKDKTRMINEALQRYFVEEAQRVQDEERSQTNLSYEEFWDDVEI